MPDPDTLVSRTSRSTPQVSESVPSPEEELTRTLVLVRHAKNGDEDALNRIMERYYERVRRIVRLRLGNKLRLRVDSGDILQDTFMKAVSVFDRFQVRNEASLINWLARIAERQIHDAADRYGAQKRDVGREVPLATSDSSGRIGVDPAASGLPPLAEVTNNESVQRLEDAIARLPEAYRELIILRDYAGLSWDDIATETGRPSAAAARMMHAKALIELGKLVDDGAGA